MIVESVRNRNLGKVVDGRNDNDNIIVKYYRENIDDPERTVEVIDDFYPKIYVPADLDWERLKDEVLVDDIHDDYEAFWHGSPVKASVESISDETFEAYDGREVRELKLANTKVVKPLRQMLEDFYSGKGDPHYEADVTFDNRYLIDTTDGQMEEKPLRTQYMDIEVSDEGGMPDIEEGRSEILSIACYDNVTEEYYIFTHKKEKVDEGEKVIEETGDYTVICFSSEMEMIAAYLDDVEEKDPSVISGWNCLPESTSIQMADGSEKSIRNVEKGDKIIGVENQETKETTVKETTHTGKKKILDIETDHGSVEATHDHRFMVGSEDGIKWKPVDDIERGEFLVKPKKFNIKSDVPTRERLLPKSIQKYDTESIREWKHREFPTIYREELSEFLGMSKKSVGKVENLKSRETIERISRFLDIPEPNVESIKKKSTHEVLDVEISESTMYKAGLIYADGSIQQNHIPKFYNTEKALHTQFDEIEEDNLMIEETEQQQKNIYNSKPFDTLHGYMFESLGVPRGNKIDNFVSLETIFQMEEKHIENFLAGVIDGDGHIRQNRSPAIQISNGSEEGREWLKKLLKRIGFPSYENGVNLTVPVTERNIDDIESLKDLMGHPDKKERIESLTPSKQTQFENIPFSLFSMDQHDVDRNRIANDKNRRDIKIKRRDTDSSDWDQFYFAEVESIEEKSCEDVYDITTDSGNFIADGFLAHNCVRFDFKYICSRISTLKKKIEARVDEIENSEGVTTNGEQSRVTYLRDMKSKIDYNRLSPVDNGVWAGGEYISVKGRELFDLYKAYRTLQWGEQESYKLGDVAQREIDRDKITMDMGFYEMYDKDFQKFLDYNKRDVELTVDLDDQMGIQEFWDEVRRICKTSLEEILISMRQVDNYILDYMNDQVILPSKSTDTEQGEDAEGGAVFDAPEGVLEDVAVLDLACLTGDHEVMTENGLRNIKEVEKGDMVYSIDPDTQKMELKEVEDTVEKGNPHGEIWHLEGNYFDMKMTPNHRMPLNSVRSDQGETGTRMVEIQDIDKGARHIPPLNNPVDGEEKELIDLLEYVEEGHMILSYKEKFEGRTGDARTVRADLNKNLFEKMEKVSIYNGEKPERVFKISVTDYKEHKEKINEYFPKIRYQGVKNGHKEEIVSDMDKMLKLTAWYISEGFCEEDRNKVSISKNKEKSTDEWVEITDLLDEMNIEYQYRSNSSEIVFTRASISNFFKNEVGRTSKEKTIPDWIYNLSQRQKSMFLEELIKGDGSDLRKNRGSLSYATSSEQLAEDVGKLMLHNGWGFMIRPNNDSCVDVVAIFNDKGFRYQPNIEKKEHEGKVYCLKVKDNHTFLAGRNGKLTWTGNSLYPNLISQYNISPETIDKENGDINVPDTDVQITTEKEGILPQVFGELFDKREEYKEKMAEAEHGTREEALYDMRQGAVKIVMNCFEEDTAIRTGGGGRKRVQNLEVGDEVMTINPDTGEKEPKEVEKMNEQYNQFEAIIKLDVKIGYDKLKMGVTPHHRMVVKEDQSSEIEIMEAQDLLEELEEGNIYYIPVERPSRVDSDVDFIWYPIKENHLYRKEDMKEDVYGPTVEDNRTIVAGNRSMMLGTGNTIYGVSLNPYFRLYNYDVGRSITKMGRETIKWSSEIADEEGFDSVYGDSVAPNTPTTVKIDGDPLTLEMEELYEFWEDDRDRKIEVWSDDGWTEVQDVIRKPIPDDGQKTMYRVLTPRGFVTVTEDHSLLDEDGNVVNASNVIWDDELLHHEIDIEMAQTDETLSDDMVKEDVGWAFGVLFNDMNLVLADSSNSIRTMIIGEDNLNKLEQILKFEFDLERINSTENNTHLKKYRIFINQKGKPTDKFRELLKMKKRKLTDEKGNERIPDFVWNANESFQKAFIDGYMSTTRKDGSGPRRTLGKLQSIYLLAKKCNYEMNIERNGLVSGSLLPTENPEDGTEVKETVEFRGNGHGEMAIGMDAVYDISTESEHFQAGIGDIIVHNTDSIFVQKRDGEPSMKEINDLAQKIDESYREFVTEVGVPEDRDMFLEMEFEKFYKRIFFAAVKKRYAGAVKYKDVGESVHIEVEDGRTTLVDPEEEIELTDGTTKKAKNLEEGDDIEV